MASVQERVGQLLRGSSRGEKPVICDVIPLHPPSYKPTESVTLGDPSLVYKGRAATKEELGALPTRREITDYENLTNTHVVYNGPLKPDNYERYRYQPPVSRLHLTVERIKTRMGIVKPKTEVKPVEHATYETVVFSTAERIIEGNQRIGDDRLWEMMGLSDAAWLNDRQKRRPSTPLPDHSIFDRTAGAKKHLQMEPIAEVPKDDFEIMHERQVGFVQEAMAIGETEELWPRYIQDPNRDPNLPDDPFSEIRNGPIQPPPKPVEERKSDVA
jgi:hypothetical protein